MMIIASLIISVIFGAVVSAVTGMGFLFWITGGVFFVCLLPLALVLSLIHGEVSYAQDRADYRQAMAEIQAEELAGERETAEDARLDRLIKSGKTRTSVYNDNRQVHLHGRLK
jgi:hypothetical protein